MFIVQNCKQLLFFFGEFLFSLLVSCNKVFSDIWLVFNEGLLNGCKDKVINKELMKSQFFFMWFIT